MKWSLTLSLEYTHLLYSGAALILSFSMDTVDLRRLRSFISTLHSCGFDSRLILSIVVLCGLWSGFFPEHLWVVAIFFDKKCVLSTIFCFCKQGYNLPYCKKKLYRQRYLFVCAFRPLTRTDDYSARMLFYIMSNPIFIIPVYLCRYK